jgi:hypothetical protein
MWIQYPLICNYSVASRRRRQKALSQGRPNRALFRHAQFSQPQDSRENVVIKKLACFWFK